MLLPYRVKVSDTKVTHFTPILASGTCLYYIDHIYGNQYRWNNQNTAESQSLKIYVQNVHHSGEHMHSNDYATAQSMMVSVTVSSLGAMQLHFLEPGVKVNGDYWRNTVLLNMNCWISALFRGLLRFLARWGTSTSCTWHVHCHHAAERDARVYPSRDVAT